VKILHFICGLKGVGAPRLYDTHATLEWIKHHAVMETRRVQNVSPNLSIVILF
jgi:hypothetical protein